jgi:hypothetical protein
MMVCNGHDVDQTFVEVDGICFLDMCMWMSLHRIQQHLVEAKHFLIALIEQLALDGHNSRFA